VKKKIFFVSLFCLFCGVLSAYSAFGRAGFLQQNLGRDFYSTGSGYTGSADLFRFNASLINPSMAATANNVKFSTGISAGWRYFERANGERELSRAREYDLPFFNIIIPYKDNFLALDFASGYSGSYEYGVGNVKEEFFANFYKVGLLYARKTPWFNIGVGSNFYLGSVQNDVITTKADRFSFKDTTKSSTSTYFDSTSVQSEDFDGRSVSYYLGISKKFENLSLGAYYYPALTIEADNSFSTTSTIFETYQYADVVTDSAYSLQDSLVTTGKETKKIEIPEIYGFGLTYKLDETWKLSLDADYQVWKECSFFQDAKMNNTFNFGIGLAYDTQREPWYWNVPFRFGYYRKEFPFEVGGKSLTEQGFTLGFDIPVNNAGDARASLALQYSTRGSKTDNGYNEQEFKVSIGFSGFDIFKSRKRLKQKREIPISSQDNDQY